MKTMIDKKMFFILVESKICENVEKLENLYERMYNENKSKINISSRVSIIQY